MLDRCGEYAFRLRRELRYGGRPQHKYHVVNVVLNLTGPEQAHELDMREPDLGNAGPHLRVFQVTMREIDAAATLAVIAADTRLLGELPWIPFDASWRRTGYNRGMEAPGDAGSGRATTL